MDLQSNPLRILTRLINLLQKMAILLLYLVYQAFETVNQLPFDDSPIAGLLPFLRPTHIREYFLVLYIQMSALTLHLNQLLTFDLLTTFDYQTLGLYQ